MSSRLMAMPHLIEPSENCPRRMECGTIPRYDHPNISTISLNRIIVRSKARIGPMLGLKRFRRANVTIVGIELLHRIRKNQFDLSKLQIQTNTAATMGG